MKASARRWRGSAARRSWSSRRCRRWNRMFGEIALTLWSAAGVAWWIIAWRLVRAARAEVPASATSITSLSLSVFKPLPPLGERGLDPFAPGLESFVAQLDPEGEL